MPSTSRVNCSSGWNKGFFSRFALLVVSKHLKFASHCNLNARGFCISMQQIVLVSIYSIFGASVGFSPCCWYARNRNVVNSSIWATPSVFFFFIQCKIVSETLIELNTKPKVERLHIVFLHSLCFHSAFLRYHSFESEENEVIFSFFVIVVGVPFGLGVLYLFIYCFFSYFRCFHYR